MKNDTPPASGAPGAEKKQLFQAMGDLTHRAGVIYHPTRVTVMDYDGQRLIEKELLVLDECAELIQRPTTTWINVAGLQDLKTLQRLGEILEIHPLALEDILSTRHPPKVDDYGNLLFFIMRTLGSGEGGQIQTEQVSIVLGESYIVTFADTENDPFEPVRQRIRQGRQRIRNSGPDYLAYAFLDAIMDGYFPVIENYANRIEALEDQATIEPTQSTVHKIQDLKREVIHLRQLSWAIRGLLTNLCQRDLGLITKDTRKYLRDVNDHAGRVEGMLESYRELCEGLYEIHVSSLSLKTNDVMKVLTIISTIFLPLNFIASIYGMNFTSIPTIHGAYGFPISITFMISIACGMAIWFRKKRWI